MLKKISIIILATVMVFSFLYSPTFVKAEEGKTLVIKLPSNGVSLYTFYKNITFREMLQLDLILDYYEDDNDHDSYLNEDGKPVFYETDEDGMFSYVLYDDVTEEDCIYTINDEIRDEVLEELGIDIFDGYNKVQFIFGELPVVDFNGYVTIDLASFDNSLDMDLFTFFMLEDSGILTDYFNARDVKYLNDINGKNLMTMEYVDDNIKYQFNVSDDVVKEDDIIYTFVDGDVDFLQNKYGINVDGYTRMILKFSDTEYNNPTDFVYDFSSLNNNSNWKYYDVWDFASAKGLVKPIVNKLEVSDDNRLLFALNEKADGIITFEVSDDLKYEDNILIDVDDNDELKDNFMDDYGMDLEWVIFVFKNPEFIEGKNQEFDSSKGNDLTFRLNIPFDRFQESGVVYLDGEIVDPNQYVASEGSTVITFKKDFVNGLNVGNHNIKVTVIDGSATASFKIVGDSPETGDHVYLFFCLLIGSISGLLIARKRLVS